jgi:hypothetical protein
MVVKAASRSVSHVGTERNLLDWQMILTSDIECSLQEVCFNCSVGYCWSPLHRILMSLCSRRMWRVTVAMFTTSISCLHLDHPHAVPRYRCFLPATIHARCAPATRGPTSSVTPDSHPASTKLLVNSIACLASVLLHPALAHLGLYCIVPTHHRLNGVHFPDTLSISPLLHQAPGRRRTAVCRCQ